MYKYHLEVVALNHHPFHTTPHRTLAQFSFGFPTFQHHNTFRSPRLNPEVIAQYLRNSPDDFRVLSLFKQPSLAQPNITMTYNYHRHQILCRLGVEQLPSLCDDEMGASMKNKCEYDGRPAPVSGDLPVRSVPVSRSTCRSPIMYLPY
jgi:hypothetical protein